MNRENLAQALKAYEYIRLPVATHVMTVSAKAGELYEMRSGLTGSDDYTSWVPQLEALWQWAGGEDLKAQLDRALLWMVDPATESLSSMLKSVKAAL